MTTCQEREVWPPCFWNAGIVPIAHQWIKENEKISMDPKSECEPAPPTRTQDDKDVEWWKEFPSKSGAMTLHVVVAGDGACSLQGTMLARAGAGLCWGKNHSHNASFPLDGHCQSSDRAELRAFLRVVRWSFAPTLYLTDNEAVAKGYQKLEEGAAKPWRDHNDLWQQIRAAAIAKEWQTRVKWIKGHATELNVATGKITEKEWDYNKGADERAVKGALAFKVPPSIKMELKKRQKVTEAWQNALVSIHEKRNQTTTPEKKTQLAGEEASTRKKKTLSNKHRPRRRETFYKITSRTQKSTSLTTTGKQTSLAQDTRFRRRRKS